MNQWYTQKTKQLKKETTQRKMKAKEKKNKRKVMLITAQFCVAHIVILQMFDQCSLPLTAFPNHS